MQTTINRSRNITPVHSAPKDVRTRRTYLNKSLTNLLRKTIATKATTATIATTTTNVFTNSKDAVTQSVLVQARTRLFTPGDSARAPGESLNGRQGVAKRKRFLKIRKHSRSVGQIRLKIKQVKLVIKPQGNKMMPATFGSHHIVSHLKRKRASMSASVSAMGCELGISGR